MSERSEEVGYRVGDYWRPIETAPRGAGVRVLGYRRCVSTADWMVVVEWDLAMEGWMEFWGEEMVEPTHWMPLPEGPA